MINYRLKIDFSDSKTLASDICFVSGDIKSSTLYFEFFNAGKRVDISGYTLTVRAKRSDGVVVASSGKIENNTAIFTPESNIYTVPGEVYMEIALSDATGKYATTKVIIAEVIEGLGEAAIEGVDNLNVYVTLLNEAVAAKDEAKSAADIAVSAKEETEKVLIESKEEIDKLLSEKVDKTEGKDLSTNDFTDEDKAKLDKLPTKSENDEFYASQEDLESLEKNIDEALPNAEKQNNNQFANAFKGSVSGNAIRIEDISPIEHIVRAKVSGDEITPENTKVQVFGKNLIPYPFPTFNVSNAELTVTDMGDGGIRINGTSTKTTYIILSPYILSNSWIQGEGSMFSSNQYNENIKTSFDPSDHTTYVSISAGTMCDNIEFYPQIEVGNKITEYEKGLPYRSFIPNADGLVEFSSVSPTMSLISDTKNVVIDVEYNQDANKVIEKISNGDGADLSNYYTKVEVDAKIGDIDTDLDDLRNYAQTLINGGAEL